MAVRSQPHNEAWHVKTNTGVILETYGNGRDALQDARRINGRRYGLQVTAVRA